MKKSVKSLGYGALGAVLSLPFVMSAAHAEIKPAPKEMCDGLDTMQAWVTGIAASLGVIGLVIIGAGMFSRTGMSPERALLRKLAGGLAALLW